MLRLDNIYMSEALRAVLKCRRQVRMSLYPVFMDLTGRACLVAGLGAVGRRKVAGLIAAGPALLRLTDPAPPHADERKLVVQARAAGVEVLRLHRPFAPEDVDGCALVFAATGDRAVNRLIAQLCLERGILCNVADDPKLSAFQVPALWRQANIQAAVSTGGASPALAAHIRDELGIFLDGRYTVLAQLLEHLRPLLQGFNLDSKQGRSADQHRELFRNLMDAGLPTALQVRDQARAAAILRRLLPKEAYAAIEPFLETLAARPERIVQ